jgi:signal recognition particle GTPase
VVLMAGLQGTGKTTATAKLALHLRKETAALCWLPPTSTAPQRSIS